MEFEAPKSLITVGGHTGILVHGDNILKPLQSNGRGQREISFYEHVKHNGDDDPLTSFLPKYHGVVERNDSLFLVLENLLFGMENPCILDLKMGRHSDPYASHEKQMREMRKYPLQKDIGFRITGMRVHRVDGLAPLNIGKELFRCATARENIPHALTLFFFDGQRMRYDLINQTIQQLQEIQKILMNCPKWEMYGSSLLFVYDGSEDANTPLQVKMIDFAHVYPLDIQTIDEGYLHGLECLLEYLSFISFPNVLK